MYCVVSNGQVFIVVLATSGLVFGLVQFGFVFLRFATPPPPPPLLRSLCSTHSAYDRSLVECFTSTSPYYCIKPSSLQLFDLLSGCFMSLLSSLSQIRDATPCWRCVLFPTMSTSGHFQFYRVYPGTSSMSQSLSINPRTPETNSTNTT